MPRRGLRSESGDGRREQVDGLEEESHRRIRSHGRIAGASRGVRRKANRQLSEEVSASEALPGWSLPPPSCLHRSARWHLLGPTSRSAKKPKRGPGAWRHTSGSQGSGLAYSPSSSSSGALGIQVSSRPGLALEGREEEGTGNDAARGATSRTRFAFAGDGEEEEEGEQEEDSGGGGGGERGGDGICDAQAVSINSGCLGGFPIGVGCAVSGEGGLAFAVQSEATSPGTGELILTGKIGKSMAESCMVALSWVKAKKRDLCLWMSLEGEDGEGSGCLVDLHRPDLDVHVNFPSCEAEKNGPSAGATVATSLVLMMTGAQLLPNIAISGEINLKGDLLPIGNVKEKVAAAARQGITHIVLSSANVKQFRRLPARIRNAVKALKANHIVEVLKHAVLPPGGRGYQARYEHRLREVAGLGLAASLACSHVKGRVQWVECCATTGRGEWHITGNVLEGTRGSVLVARTWVRRNAAAIVARLGGKTSVQVELCALHGLGPAWRLRGKETGAVGPALAAGTPSLPLEPSRRSNGKHPLSPSPGTLASGDPALLPPPQLDLHIHMPGTDVAKDVSINGAAAAVSMIAVMTGLAVRPDVAVLGEITLSGVFWPLEQVNEAEVNTAIDANISLLVLPMDNVRQLEKVPWEQRKGLEVLGALHLLDVLDRLFIFPDQRAASAVGPRGEAGEDGWAAGRGDGRGGGGKAREGRRGSGRESRHASGSDMMMVASARREGARRRDRGQLEAGAPQPGGGEEGRRGRGVGGKMRWR